MAYSTFTYAVTTVIICFILGDLSSVLFSEKFDFLTTIFYSMLILVMFISISSPVLLWLDASNYVHFINKWTEFQEELRRKRYTAQSIGRYRILRLRLSQLVSRSGGAMEKLLA
ncbi:uncharacterized protein LOC110826689 isoform X2 [Zootermopsis nevadensis]|uniref:uncharacterized protein LOC110826689 isoform X2 n=1 Tax=Zootermopsis nevadensis TaxID=136037 RepID=UPI000B8E42D1|nr:uncharacterized protein LOC110826689 isoform X2 [Zootermopsis nevadensis]